MFRKTRDELRTRLSKAPVLRRFLVSEAASLQIMARGLSWARYLGPITSSRAPSLGQINASLKMETLAKRVSVLELHADNARAHGGSASTSDKEEKKLAGSSSGTSVEYKLPLVWIDLQMTGLNVEVDRILEIACVITDGNLTKSVEGPDLVIHQNKECLNGAGKWSQSHHAASGLIEKVLLSTISEREAEKQVIEFVKSNIGTYTPNLAGNSVYVDVQFLKKYMPDLAGLFSHILVDVSSVKELCCCWYPKDYDRRPLSKEKKQRAMDSIRESIKELQYYKENIFKRKSRK